VAHTAGGSGDLSMMGGGYQQHQNMAASQMMPISSHTQSLQQALSPFAFNNDHHRAFMMNEFVKRENDRKTSLSFGYGGGSFFT